MLDGTYLRAQARRCSDLSQQCFDLTVAGELRVLSENFDAKARDLEGASKRPGVARLFERMRARIAGLPRRHSWLTREIGAARGHQSKSPGN